MTWIWISHSISWLCGSGGSDCVPSGISCGGAGLVNGSCLIGVSADVGLWKGIVSAVLLDARSRDSSNEESNNGRLFHFIQN